ncbi:hypothetical protein [Actinocorallia libanotica]|uniref:SUKH-4 immunity protein of toxin-antitoxin system n=1 Tax=Actinocorallia libanotica TaxID=46162 RepID=A0ABN1QUD7_9ACTN
MNEKPHATLPGLKAKLELALRTEAEHGFGIVFEEPRRLEDIPELPHGVIEVFRLFHRLGGDYFCFKQPDALRSRRAWTARAPNPHCPLGAPLVIGHERYGIPADLLRTIEGGAPIRLDVHDGSVYYVDPDDYVFMYKNVEVEQIDSEDFADDIITFFDHHVLGEGYPHLVEAVLGPQAATARDRRGRHKDSWMRLLETSGLLTPP